MQKVAFVSCQTQTHTSVPYIVGTDNNEVDATIHIKIYVPLQYLLYSYQDLAAAPPIVCSKASTYYNPAHQSVSSGLFYSTLRKYYTSWIKWESFWASLYIPPHLKGIQYPFPFLHIFVEWMYYMVLVFNRCPIQKLTVGQYLQYMRKYSQKWASLTQVSTLWVALTLVWDKIFHPMQENILPPCDSVPSQSPFFTALVSHIKVEPRDRSPSQTCNVLPYSYSLNQYNNAKEAPTPSSPPLSSKYPILH